MTATKVIDRHLESGEKLPLLTFIGLTGTFVLLPIQPIPLPLQLDFVDFWVVSLLFLFSLAFVAGYQSFKVCFGYSIAMWLILITSLASTFAAVDRSAGLIVVLKEAYLFAMFVVIASLLSKLNCRHFRLIMLIWCATAVLHGVLILAEFAQPKLFWFIAGFAGQSPSDELYRPSGLFFSPKAGNANKAAIFQLVGLVPLLIVKPARSIGMIAGLILIISVLATGSMGTTLALIIGLFVAAVTVGVVSQNIVLVTKIFVPSVVAMFIAGGMAAVLLGNNPGYQTHFERIFLERAEKSSDGRFDLWQSGIAVVDTPANLLLGVGPENFREIGHLEKQLHNDLLAFTVERGLFGVFGLAMLCGVALYRACYLLGNGRSDHQITDLSGVIFLSAFSAVFVVSLTHQVFHAREIWLVLAVQEAIYFRRERLEPTMIRSTNRRTSQSFWGEACET